MGVRGPAKARTYSPTAPVFAREDLRFSGRPVATRAQVPEEYFRSARDRRVLWEARKIDHAADMPVKASALISPPSAAPAALPAATAQAAEAASTSAVEPISDAELERLTAPARPAPVRRGRGR